MKKIATFGLAFAAIMSLVSCGESKQGEVVPMQNDTRMEAVEQANKNLDDGEVESVPEFSDERFAAVYENYNKVKTALVNSKAEEAGKAGSDLAASLRVVEADEQILMAAQKIAAEEDINQKRTAFREVSAAISELLQGKMASGEVYLQYCPMAFNGEGGTWLSTSQEIRNPYLPESMLQCGDVRDTLQ